MKQQDYAETMYFNMYRDGFTYRDNLDYGEEYRTRGIEFLNEVGVYQNPIDENELMFAIDSGGYGDVIRNIYYAGRLAEVTGKYVKVVFIALDETCRFHLNPDLKHTDPKKADEVIWDEHEDSKIVKSVVKEYEIPEKVRVVFSVKSSNKSDNTVPYPRVGNCLFLLTRVARAVATSHFLGWPSLKPKRNVEEKDYIAVWTTEHNKTPVDTWKDPVGWESMEAYFKNLKKMGQKLKYVSYRDEPEYIFETIANAKLCIGYEGIGNLISRMYKKPIIVFSQHDYLSRVTSGNWALVTREINSSLHDIDGIISKQKFEQTKDMRGAGLPEIEFLEYFGELNENV